MLWRMLGNVHSARQELLLIISTELL